MKKIKFLVILILATLVLSGCIVNSEQDVTPKFNNEEQTHLMKISQSIQSAKLYKAPQSEIDKIILLIDNESVYYVANDGKRYIFPTQDDYDSWFEGVTPSVIYNLEDIQKIPLGGNVSLKPGSLLKTPSLMETFVVLPGEKIAIVDEKLLEVIYGYDYKKLVISIPSYYFTYYGRANKINKVSEFPVIDLNITINEDKNI